MVDAPDSNSGPGNGVRVRFPPGGHGEKNERTMGWRVYYKQDGVTYYTKVYEDFDEADTKVTVLKLLSRDFRISDIRIVEV